LKVTLDVDLNVTYEVKLGEGVTEVKATLGGVDVWAYLEDWHREEIYKICEERSHEEL